MLSVFLLSDIFLQFLWQWWRLEFRVHTPHDFPAQYSWF